LKKIGIYPDKALVSSLNNLDKYNTSEKKALNFGVYLVDMGYVNLYRNDENTEYYIKTLIELSNDLGLKSIFTAETYQKLIDLRNNQDSLAHFVSYLLLQSDNYFKNNDQQRISVLIVTGAWIESFYLLCQTYQDNQYDELLSFLYQQKHILDNLIQLTKTYYKTSSIFDYIIENLIEVAYNFDVLDFHYSYSNPAIKKKKDLYIVENHCNITGSAPALEKIINLSFEIRNRIIQ
jgi:hypothetical protein